MVGCGPAFPRCSPGPGYGPLGDMVYFLMSVAELRVVPGHVVDFIVVLASALNRIESLRKMGLELPPPESKRPISFCKDGGPDLRPGRESSISGNENCGPS